MQNIALDPAPRSRYSAVRSGPTPRLLFSSFRRNPPMTRFEDLKLIEPLLKALREEKYEIPTPIQEKTIPHALEGKDLLGCAQTGTGKTAAFALPILQRLTQTKAQDPRDV